ncbi:MAG: AAA family ATPase [Candidatus Kerfeldbacteria bacterium]|nr:AAA family ATPase [Candidatus Kerfeldbacteria bacterium]
MRLNKLVLQGFKSFADRTVFEFTKNFTAVVGPNGSGKSNISDAIRWVLGEQSVKTLRGKESTDLIFGGSESLSKLGMAQVELYLDNSDHTVPVEFEEIVISRKIFRDGESEYRMNGAKVRLQDIIMMLAKARFGQKSYAVIGQGMITQFLNSTPQDRKIFFDEATGVREFQIKRDQAINKLIRTEEHLVQCETLITEIDPHLKSLTRQVKRLEKRAEVEQQLSAIQLDYFGSLWRDLVAEQLVLSTRAKEIGVQIAEVEGQLTEVQKQSDMLSAGASRGERYQELQKEFNAILEKKSELLKEQAIMRGRLELEHEKQGKLSLLWLERKESEVQKTVARFTQDAELLKEEERRAAAALDRAERNLKSIASDFREEEMSVIQLREQIERESHVLTVPEIQVRLEELLREQEAFLAELLETKSLDAFHDVQKKARAITTRFADLYATVSTDTRDVVESLRVQMRQKELSIERAIVEREAAQKEVNTLRVAIESAQAKAHFVREQLERAQDDLSQVVADLSEARAQEENHDAEAQARQIAESVAEYDKQIQHFDRELSGVRQLIDQFNQEEEAKKTQLLNLQSEIRSFQRKLTTLRQDMSTVEVNRARIETRQEDVKREIERDVVESVRATIYTYTSTEVVDRVALSNQVNNLKKQLELIGSVDESIVKEYEETKTRFDFLTTQTTDLRSAITQLEQVIDELDTTIHAQFQKNFKKINELFGHYFTVLFNGGKAKLELITETEKDEEQAVASKPQEGEQSVAEEKAMELIGKKKKKQKIVAGIDVLASPPAKKIAHVNALSGGEKSLVAIALLCAIIAHHPSPFVVLDEVEAALDEENSEKLAGIIKTLSESTQIIIITHNRVTMRMADILYGVTMGKEGKSHVLSVELKDAEKIAEAVNS